MDTTERMKSFLADLSRDYQDKKVLVIGHRATQFGLENLIRGIPLETLTMAHFKWQLGWEYTLG